MTRIAILSPLELSSIVYRHAIALNRARQLEEQARNRNAPTRRLTRPQS